jgi:pimeloyl-ACP methyl ester carboxylesterase
VSAAPNPVARLEWHGRPLRLEYQWVGDLTSTAPVIVFLHEGLGSVSMWRDFPASFCTEHGFRGLVFSRYGYGQSTPKPADEHWAPDFMHRQAFDVLPLLLAHLHVERPWLFGHSDGGSIALLYASKFKPAGLVVVAPHILVEDVSITSIEQARDAYATTDLRTRLARHHANPDSAFRGWNDVWLSPAFRAWNIEAELGTITCPVLAVQGEDDEYGTLEQIRGIARLVPHTELLVIPHCAHSPHRDQPETLSRAAGRFIHHSNLS